ncbi:hypothetical protein B0181_01220 [Moraxella caviae]|uniref:NAD-dependent epimerase/dehydratase domain-containing protein n=1 Tax=Moraxella caviae TaxID=34060 RepID=A0A1T0AAM0_9GAMM|nr:hypothetical protein [Moraxella caviae]OOR92784.1 hypothetical protein B0181_01220 [Moraxella caviae]STZ14180.1 Uncharacterised protein [Moraxella caviae]VEW12626.1 Uncharacterised protein [Moraxella caviae]
MANYVIIGQGGIGLALTERLADDLLSDLTGDLSAQTANSRIIGVSTSPKAYAQQARLGGRLCHRSINAATMDKAALVQAGLHLATHMVIVITPQSANSQTANLPNASSQTANPQTIEPSRKTSDRVKAYQDSYLAVCANLASLASEFGALQRIIFVSSTSVYGQNAGDIIDENTPPVHAAPTAQVLLQAENALVQAFGERAIIVRASGIYGRARTRLLRLATTAHTDGADCAHWTNRIMDTDLVAVLWRILHERTPKPLYLATDFTPASSFEVMAHLCKRLNLPAPIPKNADAGVQTGKKIISNLPREWLTFIDYQTGYDWVVCAQAGE